MGCFNQPAATVMRQMLGYSTAADSPVKQNSSSLVAADQTLTVESAPPVTAMSCMSKCASARSFTPPCGTQYI